jgi:hypothetical protein
MDDHQGLVDVLTRHGIPGGVKWRIERIAVVPGFDGGDAQLSGLGSRDSARLLDGSRER